MNDRLSIETGFHSPGDASDTDPAPTVSNLHLFSRSFAELHLTFSARQCDERCDTVDLGCNRPARRQ